MKLPFVSRERFDDERARAVKAETALEQAKDDLETLRGKFLEYIDKHRIAPLVLNEETDLGNVQPIRGRPTIANVISEANTAAYTSAKTGKSIAEELDRQREQIQKIKRVANGG